MFSFTINSLKAIPKVQILKIFNVKIKKLINFIGDIDGTLTDEEINTIFSLMEECDPLIMDRFIHNILPEIILTDVIDNLNNKNDNIVIDIFKNILKNVDQKRLSEFLDILRNLHESKKCQIRESIIELLKLSNIFLWKKNKNK